MKKRSTMFSKQKFFRYLIFTLFALGILIRFIKFPELPPGINQDEASGAYEAFALATNGTDRWGNKWPVYFPSWGSGQNVLYSYLTIPFVKLLGLNILSARIVPFIFGLLFPLLLYFSAKLAFSKKEAIVAALLSLYLPWNFMASRWGLESNMLPFTLLLGILAVQLSLSFDFKSVKIKNLCTSLCLVPFALSFYAYGVSVLVIPLFLSICLIQYRKKIANNFRVWFIAVLIFIFISLPFFLFFIKNYFYKKDFAFENSLPFSVPLLPSSRYEQVNAGTLENIAMNLKFLEGNLNDNLIWNTNPGYQPLSSLFIPLTLIGLTLLMYQIFKRKEEINIYFMYFISCIPIICLVPLNINRGNALFILFFILMSFGIVKMFEISKRVNAEKLVGGLLAIYFTLFSFAFYADYFSNYHQKAKFDFQYNFETALNESIKSSQSDQPIYVSNWILLNYMYPLFFLKVNPQGFREQSSYELSGGTYNVHNYSRFYFSPTDIPATGRFTFILKNLYEVDSYCEAETKKLVFQDELWTVGNCQYRQL
jgi:4-amino-4-deoxy-L-arabinose transferase-like glycosyltransferase